jgi:hypothetical protein
MTDIPAFPLEMVYTQENEKFNGMLLRDYFAAAALPAMITSFLDKDLDMTDPHGWMEGLAMDAYSMADAMMKQRDEK